MGLRETLNLVHQVLEKAAIPHALIGGLALGAHGVNRATKDVDFLVEALSIFFWQDDLLVKKCWREHLAARCSACQWWIAKISKR